MRKQEKGQSLFEIVFALGLVSLILVAIVSLSTQSIRNANFSKNNVLATNEAQAATEWLRSQRDQGWTTFLTKATAPDPTYCLPDLSTWPSSGACASNAYVTGSTIFKRTVVLNSRDAQPSGGDGTLDTVDAEIIVTWNDSQGFHQVKNQASFTDWRR